MELGEGLGEEELRRYLPERELRTYPALLSTEADGLAWARSGGPEGAVVVADYQASPRGRGGLEWSVREGRDLAFSLVLRPELPVEREGWIYTIAVSGLADALGPAAEIEWPDEVLRDGGRAGAVGVHVELGPERTAWAVVNVHVLDAGSPRAALLATVVEAIEARYRSPTTPVLADYLRRCRTFGHQVCARMIPLGPDAVEIVGTALTTLPDGALRVEQKDGRRVAVRPQHVGTFKRA